MAQAMDARPAAALREAKQALRAMVLAARDAIPAEVHARLSAAIAARIAVLPSFASARSVLLTLPFRSEWDSRELARGVIASGRRLVLPRVDRDARMLALHAVADLDDDVTPGYLGIPEPREACASIAPADVDFVLVPGVAFDQEGLRLGYGGGFYDRLVPLLRPDAALVAGAFDEQVVDAVPAASHDARVALLLTPTRAIATGGR
jgi:5,10-methenyltetrahydrofolate synthetase